MDAKKLTGIVTPLVTPLTDDMVFDRESFLRLVGHVVGGGVHGIFVLGTTGEGAGISGDVRTEIIDAAVRSAGGRVQVLVNITSPSYLESLEFARQAASAGADYVALAPPYYYPMNQEELRRYCEGVAEASKLPVFLYNAPQYTGKNLEVETVKLLALHSNIAGIKDSSGDIGYFKRLVLERAEEKFCILTGPEKMLGECILLGGDGGVNGGSNLFPELYVNMFRAAQHKDMEKLRLYQQLIGRIYENIYEVPGSPMGIVIGLKYALSVKGICGEKMAAPVYDQMTDPQKEKIKAFINEMDRHDF